jgi:hypothetical protein
MAARRSSSFAMLSTPASVSTSNIAILAGAFLRVSVAVASLSLISGLLLLSRPVTSHTKLVTGLTRQTD